VTRGIDLKPLFIKLSRVLGVINLLLHYSNLLRYYTYCYITATHGIKFTYCGIIPTATLQQPTAVLCLLRCYWLQELIILLLAYCCVLCTRGIKTLLLDLLRCYKTIGLYNTAIGNVTLVSTPYSLVHILVC